jgi:Arc/MetJ-type ribon-helix-helix transcriptional regulator
LDVSAGISPDNQEFIDQAVEAGHYASPDDVVDEAVSRLREYHALKQEINRRVDEMEAGNRIEIEDDEQLRRFFDEIKEEGRRRLAGKRGDDVS